MKNKMLVALGSAAILFSIAQSAAATEQRDTRKVARHHMSSSRISDARVRDARDEWRPLAAPVQNYPGAYYNGAVPMLAGH
jgi:hypothetical protein